MKRDVKILLSVMIVGMSSKYFPIDLRYEFDLNLTCHRYNVFDVHELHCFREVNRKKIGCLIRFILRLTISAGQ